jgi:hypothetical protein
MWSAIIPVMGARLDSSLRGRSRWGTVKLPCRLLTGNFFSAEERRHKEFRKISRAVALPMLRVAIAVASFGPCPAEITKELIQLRKPR